MPWNTPEMRGMELGKESQETDLEKQPKPKLQSDPMPMPAAIFGMHMRCLVEFYGRAGISEQEVAAIQWRLEEQERIYSALLEDIKTIEDFLLNGPISEAQRNALLPIFQPTIPLSLEEKCVQLKMAYKTTDDGGFASHRILIRP